MKMDTMTAKSISTSLEEFDMNWFGMQEHPTDDYVSTGLTTEETVKLANFLRKRYDAIIGDHPECKIILDEMLEVVDSCGFDRGYDSGYDSCESLTTIAGFDGGH